MVWLSSSRARLANEDITYCLDVVLTVSTTRTIHTCESPRLPKSVLGQLSILHCFLGASVLVSSVCQDGKLPEDGNL